MDGKIRLKAASSQPALHVRVDMICAAIKLGTTGEEELHLLSSSGPCLFMGVHDSY